MSSFPVVLPGEMVELMSGFVGTVDKVITFTEDQFIYRAVKPNYHPVKVHFEEPGLHRVLESKYTYDAVVDDNYDGDTVTLTVDLGFNIEMKEQKFRLYGVNTPEIRGPDKERGKFVRDELSKLIENKPIKIKTVQDKKGKFGRWLAVLFVDELNVNQWLIDNNYGEIYLP